MGYICVKKLCLAGRDYLPGDSIPEDAFVSGRADKLKSYGYIAEAEESVSVPPEVPPVSVPVFNITLGQDDAGEPVTIALTEDHLQAAVDLLRKSAADAVSAIENEWRITVLTFTSCVDTRKTVLQAATKQLSRIANQPVSDAE